MKGTKIIRVPSTIRLSSHEYEILFDEVQEDREFRGTFSSRTNRIYLNPLLGPQQLRITYLHELIHAICDLGSISAPEQDIARIAEGVGEVLFRNFDIDFDFRAVKTLERREKQKKEKRSDSK